MHGGDAKYFHPPNPYRPTPRIHPGDISGLLRLFDLVTKLDIRNDHMVIRQRQVGYEILQTFALESNTSIDLSGCTTCVTTKIRVINDDESCDTTCSSAEISGYRTRKAFVVQNMAKVVLERATMACRVCSNDFADPKSLWKLCEESEKQDVRMAVIDPVAGPIALGFVSQGSSREEISLRSKGEYREMRDKGLFRERSDDDWDGSLSEEIHDAVSMAQWLGAD